MATYLINPKTLKETAYVDENVDDKLLSNTIVYVQDLYILPKLGTGLLNELKTQIDAGTLTALNTTLLSTYVKPVFVYLVLSELPIPMNMKLTNIGIVEKRSENSEPIAFNKIVAFGDKFKNIAEYYAERLKLYLCEHSNDYPLYLNPGTGVDIVRPDRQSYTGGWYLGDDPQQVPDFIKAEYPLTYGS